ncbi:hypothetical protein [Treponema zioleckii]|uniref:hypothetical protein n=1 Tax=Treponema zioleckii TaxID=331680 RepID=UPI00168B3749|nr:hypothetical protein [Treponema zioleckii]
MSKIKSLILTLITFFSVTSLFAGESSFIKVTSPANEDTRYVYNTETLKDYKVVFDGTVSKDCKSIRVLWSPKSRDKILDHLMGNKNTGVDDFILKKYVAGSSTFQYNASGAFDNLEWGSNHFMFIATFKDGTTKSYSMTLYVHQGGFAEKGKPVIYLYPKKKQTVKVSAHPEGGVTKSIPEMGKQWKVTAYPDGKIVDSKTKKEYPYLFWEGKDNNEEISLAEGFVLKTEELESFFNEKLSYQGLNEKEIADFNEFWIPVLQGKEYIFITFRPQAQLDKEAPLKISPKPDSVIRVFFDYKKLDEPIETKEQALVKAERTGFAVIEWGGRLYK